MKGKTTKNNLLRFFIFILLAGASVNGWGQTIVNLYGNVWKATFTSSNASWTVPANTTTMNIYAIGGGGAGGGSSTTDKNGAGGGGGACAIKYNYTSFTPGSTSLAITVGSGGTGVNSGNDNPGTAKLVDLNETEITENTTSTELAQTDYSDTLKAVIKTIQSNRSIFVTDELNQTQTTPQETLQFEVRNIDVALYWWLIHNFDSYELKQNESSVTIFGKCNPAEKEIIKENFERLGFGGD